MKNWEQEILKSGVLTPEQLEKAVEQKMNEGARSRRSAARKVYREVAQEEIDVKDIEGFFLGQYERQRGGISLYIQTPKKTTKRITIGDSTPDTNVVLKVGDPIKLTNVRTMSNRFTGNTWLETGPKTEPVSIESEITVKDCFTPMEKAEKVTLIRAEVGQVFAVSKYENGEISERLPILGTGDEANLRLVLVAGEEDVSVRVVNKTQLRNLVGRDLTWLDEEDAIRELADMLIGEEVLVFGTIRREFGRGKDVREVNPYMMISNFGWIVKIGNVSNVEKPAGNVSEGDDNSSENDED